MADVTAKSTPLTVAERSYDNEDTSTLRYNVTAVDGLFTRNGNGIRLRVNYLNTGEHSSVAVSLFEYDLTKGRLTERLTFKSNPSWDSQSYQSRSVSAFTPADFDFGKNVYYVEVTLKMVHGSVNTPFLSGPKVAAIQLEKTLYPLRTRMVL